MQSLRLVIFVLGHITTTDIGKERDQIEKDLTEKELKETEKEQTEKGLIAIEKEIENEIGKGNGKERGREKGKEKERAEEIPSEKEKEKPRRIETEKEVRGVLGETECMMQYPESVHLFQPLCACDCFAILMLLFQTDGVRIEVLS